MCVIILCVAADKNSVVALVDVDNNKRVSLEEFVKLKFAAETQKNEYAVLVVLFVLCFNRLMQPYKPVRSESWAGASQRRNLQGFCMLFVCMCVFK